MPDFTVEAWETFKQSLISVIQWLLSSIQMVFDTCAKYPMLFCFLVFPVFAIVFFLIFDMITGIVRLKPLFDSSDIKSDNSMLKVPEYQKNTSYNRQLNHDRAVQKVQSDMKAHSAMINKLNAGSRGESSKAPASVSLGSALSAPSSNGKDRAFKESRINPSTVSVKAAASPGSPSSFGNGSLGSSNVLSEAHQGIGTGAIGFSVKAAADKIRQKKADDKAAQEEYEKVAEEQQKLANQRQADKDRNFNTHTDYYYSKDDDGNPVTRTVKTNTRTGEVISDSVSVRHTND